MQIGKRWHVAILAGAIGGIGYFGLLPYARFGLTAAHLDEVDPFRIRHGGHLAVPSREIAVGAVKDQIPALTNPKFVPAAEAPNWLRDGERVVGIARDREAKAYPALILLWHEAVNDRVGDEPVLVSY